MNEKRISEECDALERLLIAKNAAYGDSASRAPILRPTLETTTAIFVRMSDKIARIRSLLSGAEANEESLDDTIRDLAGYCVLYLATKEKKER